MRAASRSVTLTARDGELAHSASADRLAPGWAGVQVALLALAEHRDQQAKAAAT